MIRISESHVVSTRSISRCAHCGLHGLCIGKSGDEDVSLVGKLHVRQGTLARGKVLFWSGQRNAAFYALRSGCVKDVVTRPNGTESIVHFSLPGEVLGLGSLATSRAGTTAIAVQSTRYCRVPAAAVHKLAEEMPDVGRELVRLLATTVMATQQLVASVLNRDALARVAGCVLDISSRMQRSGLDGSRFRLGLSRSDLASYLGVTLETVSRCLAELHRRRLIDVHAKDLRLLRPAELKQVFG
jgi:CRP/FNR family transcriptional regulator